jgi:hypothetical protein
VAGEVVLFGAEELAEKAELATLVSNGEVGYGREGMLEGEFRIAESAALRLCVREPGESF